LTRGDALVSGHVEAGVARIHPRIELSRTRERH
jgi:hypothetical protein